MVRGGPVVDQHLPSVGQVQEPGRGGSPLSRVAPCPGLRLSRDRCHARAQSAFELTGGVDPILSGRERHHQRPIGDG